MRDDDYDDDYDDDEDEDDGTIILYSSRGESNAVVPLQGLLSRVLSPSPGLPRPPSPPLPRPAKEKLLDL